MRWLQGLFGPGKAETFAHQQAVAAAAELQDARLKRKAALAEYKAAKVAGDTRRMNEASKAARRATNLLMRLETSQ